MSSIILASIAKPSPPLPPSLPLTPSGRPSEEIGALSGGNQQKIILSKWLSSDVKVLILDHPTRGIDIGAKDEVYRLIRKFSEAGIAMIIMCDTLEEDIGLANKLLVMSDHKMVEMLDASPGHKPTPKDLITLIT